MDGFIYTRKLSQAVDLTTHGLRGRSPRLRSIKTIPDKLRTALSRSSLDTFWNLVKAGADVQSRDRLNRTPLHLVIYWRKELAVVKAVLSAGADPNAVDDHGLTPLHAAIHSNASPAIIKALISAGAEVDILDRQGQTPLITALHKEDSAPTIKVLLSAGANVNMSNIMVEAVKGKANHEILRLFLMAGASVNSTCCGFPPMLYAVINGDPTIVKMLLVAGARIDYLHPESRSTLLHHATIPEIARDLIKHGVYVNAVDSRGETPLHRAVMGDHLEVVIALLNAGANVHSVVPRMGNNCLHMARSARMIKLLASRGVDINARNRIGETPLHTLISSCSVLLSPLVHVRGFFVRYYKDSDCLKLNDTVLAVKEILKRGAHANSSDISGTSILESTVTHGHSKMVAYMLRCGVEVCWQKLFRLEVMNQSALQLLIRESLIGNVIVKGEKLFENCPTEQPFLQAVKPLMVYTKRCLAEIELMKSKKVNCNRTLHHFIVGINPKIEPLRFCPHTEVSEKDIEPLFPIYKCLVTMRFNLSYKRGLLLDCLESTNIGAPRLNGQGTVYLINDCKLAIAELLCNNALFNFLYAMNVKDPSDGLVLPPIRYRCDH